MLLAFASWSYDSPVSLLLNIATRYQLLAMVGIDLTKLMSKSVFIRIKTIIFLLYMTRDTEPSITTKIRNSHDH